MNDDLKTYRIRTKVGEDKPTVINVPLTQTYDTFEILSLKLDQSNSYKYYTSDYGVIVGRVLANGGVGIPNAKVSIFIEGDETTEDIKKYILYHYSSVQSTDNDGVRYNLLPDEIDEACHQNVGTFPNKRLVLDNKDVMEIFDKYWKYTTVTNEAGDYMLFGIPTGSQQLHVDIDLSDIGIWSQRPRDLVYKGYNINQFDSPNKFKTDTNLNSLSQIYSQDRGLYVYPYWGEATENGDTIGITRCDIQIDYKFEPTCIFMGSIVTDKGNNAIGKNCTGTDLVGKMSDLSTGEGSIEMIRKTFDNKVEQVQIKGNRVIDGDGVWCYQIPMNLDYVMTDEFGNLVPSDNPDRGIPTRTRVRFRISMDEQPNDGSARKRCKYLVPNNPHIDDEGFKENLDADYEFGSATREESYCDMFWNKVYTVKNYIPRLQKNSKVTNRKHTGIKLINHYGDNNPMPYNGLSIKLTFTFRLICVITKMFIKLVGFLNNLISILGYLPCWLGSIKLPLIGRPFKFLLKLIPGCIELSSEFCDDGINPNIYFPGCGKPFGCVWDKKTRPDCQKEQSKKPKEEQMRCTNSSAQLYTCVENELAQSNDATSFNFYNDWINGSLYAPLWYRKITPKKSFLFGLFKRKAKDEWCSADREFGSLRLMQSCAVARPESKMTYSNFDGKSTTMRIVNGDQCGNKCHETVQNQNVINGVISSKLTMLGQTVYYYRAVEYDPTAIQENNSDIKGAIKTLFATDIVLLGSLNDCDTQGIPQFFKNLDSSTYNLPSDILFTDNEIVNSFDENGNLMDVKYTSSTEMSGCDWGNKNEFGKTDGGLFYGIGCSTIEVQTKSCVNLSRICEFGVSLDESRYIPNLKNLSGDENAYDLLIADGFVSHDELYNIDGRSMFATMNGNRLKTKLNTTNGLMEYDFRYLYPENFDGSLEKIMRDRTSRYGNDVNYKNNYNLETASLDYYIFRMGNNPYYYDKDYRFPRYENSFYFYFGLKNGKTAIEKFNSQFFSECETVDKQETSIGIKVSPNSWCTDNDEKNRDGYVALDVSGIATPYDIIINSTTNLSYSVSADGITSEKIIFKGNKASTEEIKKLTDKGYIVFDGIKNLENSEYQLTITDADGEITTSTFRMIAPYLTYKTYVDKFNQPDNVLQSDFANMAAIANDKNGLAKDFAQVIENSVDSREIGGVIVIYDIYFNNDILKDYKVEIKPLTSDFTNDGSYTPVTYNSKGTSTGNGFLGKVGDYLVFGLPKGDVRYSVTVTQLCDGVDSKNSVEKTLLVEQPMPYKLYINDVDYDVIKDGFDCGWTISGKTDNIKLSRGRSVKGWLTNLDNVDDFIGDNNGLFNWDNNDTYKLEYYIDDMDDYKLNPDKYADNVEEMKDARRQFINSFKETFYLSCPSSSLSLNVSVRTDDYPYSTAIIYRPEMVSTDDEYNTFDGCDSKLLTTDNQVDDVKIPTITNFDNTRYGGGDKLTDAKIKDAVFARDINSSCTKESLYKHPYFIAAVNSKGKTLPSKNVGTVKENDSYVLSGNIAGYFGFHIIDRMLVNNFLSWAYITDIPYFKPSNTNLNGKNLVMKEGLFAGILYNGSPTSVDADGKTLFESQTLSGVTFNINTISDGTSMATKRVITGPNLLKTYKNYKVDNVINAYATLPPISARMNIEDSNGCQIDETIFGGMKMTASGSSINNITTDERILKINLANADSSGDTYYYIYSTDGGDKYPINLIGIDTIVNMKDADEWTNDNNSYRLFNYKTSKDTLQRYVDGGVKSTVPDSEDVYKANESSGYGTTGIFTKIGGGKSYYVVAVTENNCRAISPVFDFVNLKGVVEVSKIYSKIEDSTEEAETEAPVIGEDGNPVLNEDGTPKTEKVKTTVTKYRNSEDNMIGFYIDGLDANANNPYYFNKYRYSLEATCEIDSLHKVTASGVLSGGTNSPIYTTITDSSAYDILNSYASLPFNLGNKMIKKKTTFTAVDYTNLTHVFSAEKLVKKDRYRILLSLNDQEGKGTYHFTETNPDESDYTDRVLYLEKNDTYELPNAYDDDGAKLLFWTTLKEAKWDSEPQEGEIRVTPVGNKTVTESMIWYAIWHMVEYVTFKCDGGTWNDGTTADSRSEITDSGEVTCMKGDPVSNKKNVRFGGWQCDDVTVTIKEDGTVVTDHACTIYPKWIISYVVRWMDNDI